MLVLPADHLIRDGARIRRRRRPRGGARRAKAGSSRSASPRRIRRPASATSNAATPLDVDGARSRVQRFVEKPPLAEARGVPRGRQLRLELRHVLLHRRRRSSPRSASMRRRCSTRVRPRRGRRCARDADATMLEIDAALFAAVPDISIDYAVMEKAAPRTGRRRARRASTGATSDRGRRSSELTDADADGNRGQGERVAIDTRDTFVHAGDRVVATVGVENLVIVDTPDAVLVAHRDHLQRVREVVGELKARGHETYKLHRTVARPWGAYTVLQEGRGFKIKRIEVKPGASLSLQLHHRRSEHWVVVSGTARVTSGERRLPLSARRVDVHSRWKPGIGSRIRHRRRW